MSSELISLSPDLVQLQNLGYEVQIKGGYLLISHVPYVTAAKQIEYGVLVSELTLAGKRTAKPSNHVTQFVGSQPCEKDGSFIKGLQAAEGRQALFDGLVVDRTFSNKPNEGYADYFQKMGRYVEIISAPAASIDASATAQTFKVIESPPDDSPFVYLDTNASRARINVISAKLQGFRIGIVGLGGTGSYVLDLVSKTPVREIHLFDGDRFLQHNSFRAPGAASIDKLNEAQSKVDYLTGIYSKMHKGIRPHAEYLTAANAAQLDSLGFVFLCMDAGENKRRIVEHLVERGIPFVDTGLGVQVADDKLLGIVRATTVTSNKKDHIGKRISFNDAENDDYSTNIQIAELNMLAASMAVIKWKKLVGFYVDLEHEFNSTYTLDGSMLLNEDTHP